MSRKQRFQKKETNVVTFNNYVVKTRDVTIIPRNRNQEKYIDLLENSKNYITIAIGDAGTGKTYLAMLAAIRALKENKIDKLILTRPAVGVDNEKHGFLPGNLDDKMQPWLIPLFDVLEEFYDPKQIKSMLDNKTIDISPLAFMRGRNLKRAYIIADEMQNSTVGQLKMLLSRFSDDSNFVLFSQDYFDSCKVYVEIKNENGEVCFFDDLTVIKNIEYWFGAQFNGKKTFTIYDSNKSIILFQITSI